MRRLLSLVVAGVSAASGTCFAQAYQFTVSTAPGTVITGLNDTGGMVVGSFSPAPSCTVTQSGITAKLTPPSPRQLAWCTGISNAGTATGYVVDPGTITAGFTTHADHPRFQFTTLPVYGATLYGISSHKQYRAGIYYDTGKVFHGYTIIGHTVETFEAPGATNTYVQGINDFGISIMNATDARFRVRSYIKSGGTYRQFSFPGAVITQPNAINNAGVIVGSYLDANYVEHGMVYDSAKNIYYTVDVPNAVNTQWQTINNSNTLGGSCTPVTAAANHAGGGGGGGGSTQYAVSAVGTLPR